MNAEGAVPRNAPSNAENGLKQAPAAGAGGGGHQIAVWMGGSFSPPTTGHMNTGIQVAKALLRKNPGAHITVYYTPVSVAYNKLSVKEACVPVAERLALMQLLISELNSVKAADPELASVDFVLSTIETDSADAVKTFDSAQKLAEKYGITPADIYLAVGQDNIEGLLKGTWYKWKELLSAYHFVVFPRDDAAAQNEAAGEALKEALAAKAAELGVTADERNIPFKDRLLMVDAKSQGISSTALRSAIRAGDEAAMDANTFASIKDYIKAKGLYMDEAACEMAKKGGRRRKTSTRRKTGTKISVRKHKKTMRRKYRK
jgi:nicotinate (nicotinamide) nucleotide adenylyltransferase